MRFGRLGSGFSRLGGGGGASAPGIRLSASSFEESSAQNTSIGTLSVSGGTGTYTFTLTDSASSKVQVAGANGENLQVGSASSSVGTFTISVNADNGAGSTFDADFTLSALPQAPTLVDLTAASDAGTSSTDNITNINTPSFDVTCATTPVADDVIEIYKDGTLLSSITLTAGDISGSTAQDLGLSALADGTYAFTAKHKRGTLSSAASSGTNITVDTDAPVLSSASGVQNGSTETEADLSVTTDKGEGTIYWVVTTNSSTPTADQIKTGKDASGSAAPDSGTIAVGSTGAKIDTAAGLSTNTYYMFAIQSDVAGNDSNIVSDDWSQTVSAFTANAVAFDSSTKLTLATATGPGSTRKILISVWYKPGAGGDGTARYIASGTHSGSKWWLYNQTNNRILFHMRGTDGVDRVDVQTAKTNFTAANGWRHLAIAIDVDAGTGQVYSDGASDYYTTHTINGTSSPDVDGTYYVCANTSGTINGTTSYLAELYINFNETLDLSSNITKFRSAGGAPISLGATGALPTGNQPNVYLGGSHDYTNWQTNLGTAGNYTVTGALASATGP